MRSPRGLLPTLLAQEIAPSVRSILEQVEGVLSRLRSEPRAPGDSSFRLSDYAAFCLPQLIARLDHEAPGIIAGGPQHQPQCRVVRC